MTMDCSSEGSVSEEELPPTSERALHEMPSGDKFLSDEKYQFDRDFFECLLSSGELLYNRETILVDTVTPAQTELLTPWAMLAPNPKFLPFNPVRKKQTKATEERVSLPSASVPKASTQLKEIVDDSFRYVPNNGKYRLAKVVAAQTHSSAITNWKRMRPLDKYMSPEQRVLQREVQRALKRDQDQRAEKERERLETESKSREEKGNAETLRVVEPNIRLSTPVDPQDFSTVKTAMTREPMEAKSTTQPQIHEPGELQDLEVPSSGAQRLDRFEPDALSKRMSVLEEEMRRDENMFRRTNPGTDDLGLTGSVSEPTHTAAAQKTLQRTYTADKARVISDGKKTVVPKTQPREHDGIVEDGHLKSRQSMHSILEGEDTRSSSTRDLTTPRQRAVFYKVDSASSSERLMGGASSAPSRSNFPERDGAPASDGYLNRFQRHEQQRRALSFDHNMMQRAKTHRDFRLSNQVQEKHIRQVTSTLRTKTTAETSSASIGKQVKKVKPRDKNKPSSTTGKNLTNSDLRVPVAKIAAAAITGVGGVSLGKTRVQDKTGPEDEFNSASHELMPRVAGKRLSMSIGNQRVL